MRLARPLVIALVAFLAPAATALGAERSGSATDPAGDVTSADGFARPDVADFRVALDPDVGALTTTVRFHDPVPRTQSGRSTAFKVVYNTGRTAPENFCDWTGTGDLGVRIDVVRAPDGDYILQTATPRGGADLTDNAAGSFSADSRTLTVRTVRSQFVGRDDTCVSPTRVTYEPLAGADEIGGFFFAGFAPGAPPPDSQRPTVRWESPTAGATISGVYSEGGQNGSRVCRLSASDNVRVNRIEIFVDGVLNEVQRFAPWGCELDTRRLADGAHLLRADAYDEAGNLTSTTISVTVRNAGTTPPPPPSPVVLPPGSTPTPPVVPAREVVQDPVPTPVVQNAVPPVAAPPPDVISRLEPFMRCRLVGGAVQSCRAKPSAFLSVRVTGPRGLRIDRSGAVRVAVRCTPTRRCAARTVRLRGPRLSLASMVRGSRLTVGTTVTLRVTRPGSVGRLHTLRITPAGPVTRTCELRGGRSGSCE